MIVLGHRLSRKFKGSREATGDAPGGGDGGGDARSIQRSRKDMGSVRHGVGGQAREAPGKGGARKKRGARKGNKL